MKRFYPYILFACLITVSCQNPKLFEQVSSFHSGIHFNNKIEENDSINPLDIVNIYNGGGVGVGDFNNDGLQDLYFTGSLVSNKLYINKGDFKFEDVTDKANVGGKGRWARGVAVVDINGDGLLDIYVCNTIYPDSNRRTNLLYVNQGISKDGVPHFKEMAKEYGLDVHMQSTMATFFDYDNDGKLDVYITDNEAGTSYYPNLFGPAATRLPHQSMGRLFHNDWDPKLKHPVFHDVSAKAHINVQGLGHAATIVDINRDGWKDIYVSNDFLSPNILYINNHDGTFTDRSMEYFKHTSFNAMGQDVVDINNDGLADVFELDMNPEDNYRKKMMLPASSYQNQRSFDLYHIQYQYIRNTLQLNQGPRVMAEDSVGSPAFSEIGFLSGIAQTDWSWTPLIADFNNDGYRDVIVTNGFPKDVTDHDFMTYRQNAFAIGSKKKVLDQIPSVKIHNYAFRNKGDLTFADATSSWGLSVPTFSNGAVYVDLNNDGAMDMVINNIDDEALIYRNTAREKDPQHCNFLEIKFKGEGQNVNGLGAWADIYYDHGKHQVAENNPYRGYLSTDQNVAHFGLGDTKMIDSVVICWPDHKKQVITGVRVNQLLTVSAANARTPYDWTAPKLAAQPLFTDVTKKLNVNYHHTESDFVDFNIQKLLPHKLSEYDPALAVGDLDGNGLDDIVVGGNSTMHTQVFLQQPDGRFMRRNLFPQEADKFITGKDEGILLFDANGDGKTDVYITRGGYAAAPGSADYQDLLYINDGRGNFTQVTDALPVNHASKLCVRACDFNKDGKPDLFVSGRVEPWAYPKPVSSFILRNDSKDGKVKFTDVTAEVAPALKNIGLVCDALFSDYDNDGWPDLILAGEWMPVTILKNNSGRFKNITAKTGLAQYTGWWSSITAGDFRHTGRTDYIVGNIGRNSFFKASNQYPVCITAKDFAQTGSYNAFPSLFLPDQHGELKEFPAHGRDDILKEMISLKKKFTNYKSYATATMSEIFSEADMKGALKLKANQLQSCYLRNDGHGKFTLIPLPMEAQFSVVNGMVADDFDGDGNLDLAINGNDYGTDVFMGRYDAFNGLVLKGDDKGGFKPLSIMQSGLYLPGNGKALVKFRDKNGGYCMASSEYKGPLKLFMLNAAGRDIDINADDAYALITYRDGRKEKKEFYYGTSFLSQSARFLRVTDQVKNVVLFNNKNVGREINVDRLGYPAKAGATVEKIALARVAKVNKM